MGFISRMLPVAFVGWAGFATSANAQPVGTFGGWQVDQFEDGCGMGMEFEGPGTTMFLLMTRIEDGQEQVVVSASNYNWSAVDGTEYDIAFGLNGTSYGDGYSAGTHNGSRKGFLSAVDSDFIDGFAQGNSLRIYLEGNLIDQLSLDGTAVAVTQFRRCVARVRGEMAATERERQRWEYLPRDPFATATPSGMSGAAEPRGNPGFWVTTGDYPSAALRAREQGVTGFTLAIGQNGRVTACQITNSSGHETLDAQTCRLIQRRARFSPARSDSGQPMAGTYSSSVRWSIPEPVDPLTSDIP